MWLQVVTYSFGITLVSFLLRPDIVGKRQLVYSLFPVLTSHYWYFCAYTGLFFLIPFLNEFVRKCDEKYSKNILVVIFFIFSFYGTVANYFSDPFKLNNGYSFLWLLLLYLIGAIIRKLDIFKSIKTINFVYLLFVSLFLTWINVVFIHEKYFGKILLSYLSPTILIMGLCYFNLFFRIKLKENTVKLVKLLSPSVFAVYLIHVQEISWDYFMKDRFSWIANVSVFNIIFLVLFYSFLIFLLCIFIEKLRRIIFKFLKIDLTFTKLVKNFLNIFNFKNI